MFRRKTPFLVMFAMIAALFMAVGCGDDDNPANAGGDDDDSGDGGTTGTMAAPLQWQGTWQGTEEMVQGKNAGTSGDVFLNICPEGFTDIFNPNDECPWLFLGNDVSYECEFSFLSIPGDPGCEASFVYTLDGQVNGTTITYTRTMATVIEGDCPEEIEEINYTYEGTLTQVSSTPEDCMSSGDDDDDDDVVGDDDDDVVGDDDDDDVIGNNVPADWVGEYRLEFTFTDCTSGFEQTQESEFSVCPDDLLEDVGDDPNQECTITFDDINEVRAVCSSENTSNGCTTTSNSDMTITRTADGWTYSGNTTTIIGAGCPPEIPDFCTNITGTATKISSTPSFCPGKRSGAPAMIRAAIEALQK